MTEKQPITCLGCFINQSDMSLSGINCCKSRVEARSSKRLFVTWSTNKIFLFKELNEGN